MGVLYERRHTREIAEYGGISNVMPVYATITLIMFLSSMGLPLLNGFIGEFTILQGTFMENWKWAAWAVPGVVLAAAYLLWLYQRVFFGTVTNPKNEKLHDLTPREIVTFVPLIIMALVDRPLPEAVLPDSRTARQPDCATSVREVRKKPSTCCACHARQGSRPTAPAAPDSVERKGLSARQRRTIFQRCGLPAVRCPCCC